MSECLDDLDGNVWFSRLYANSAYWQLPLHPDSQEKTAFRTRHGLWEFKKLPFGLAGSPSSYSRAMGLVLRGMNWKTVLAFLDDICVLGKSTREHLKNLKKVLQRIIQYGLKLKPKKCQLFQKKIEFLGRIVSANGMNKREEQISEVFPYGTNTPKLH